MNNNELSENTLPIGLHLITNSVSDPTERAMVQRWRKEYELYANRRARANQILKAVAEGYDTISEIVFFTNIPSATCYRILKKLSREKKLKIIKTKNRNKRLEFRFSMP